jgi:hypothetical protein
MDYASQVFQVVPDAQSAQLLLAAEAVFLASIEIRKAGIREWERLLEKGKIAREVSDRVIRCISSR